MSNDTHVTKYAIRGFLERGYTTKKSKKKCIMLELIPVPQSKESNIQPSTPFNLLDHRCQQIILE